MSSGPLRKGPSGPKTFDSGKVLVSSTDQLARFLSEKLNAGPGITLTITSPGGDEGLLIDTAPVPPPVSPLKTAAAVSGSPTPIFSVNLSLLPDASFYAKIFYAVECTDGVDAQIRGGDFNAAISLKAGVPTTAQAQNATSAITGGTLTTTGVWTTSPTLATFNITPVTSLTPTRFRVNYYVLYTTHPEPIYIPIVPP